jgi:hypothetical protein
MVNANLKIIFAGSSVRLSVRTNSQAKKPMTMINEATWTVILMAWLMAD